VTDERLERAIDDFFNARTSGVYFPPQWYGKLSLDDGCQVQLGVLKRLVAGGATHIGWKVGLTSEAIQRQFDVPEPVFGFLLADGVYQSPARLEFDALIQPGIENEMCVTIGHELRGPGVDVAQARAAVQSVRSAMELVETRGPFTEQLAVALGENVQQKGVILSADEHVPSAEFDFSAVEVELQSKGSTIDRATGVAVLGNPLLSIAWLANKLAQYGLGLEAGQLVMTGSLTRQYRAERGDTFRANWRPLGAVVAEFV
jgi:2-keto-4-pentenoate hydratase